MNDPIESWHPAVDGELSQANMRRKLEARGSRVTCYVYPPGTHFPSHTHDVDKIDAVHAGRFRVILDGQTVEMTAGDCLAVPTGVVHSAEVVGADAVVSLDAVKQD